MSAENRKRCAIGKEKKKGKQLKLKNTTGLWPVNKEVKGKFVRREGNVMQKKRMFREARQAIWTADNYHGGGGSYAHALS